MHGIRKFLRDDDALAITEYGLLVTFIAIVVIAVVSIFGGQIGAWLASRTSQITTV